jgi:hypothetical protein
VQDDADAARHHRGDRGVGDAELKIVEVGHVARQVDREEQ